jgi:hypothetical protein
MMLDFQQPAYTHGQVKIKCQIHRMSKFLCQVRAPYDTSIYSGINFRKSVILYQCHRFVVGWPAKGYSSIALVF